MKKALYVSGWIGRGRDLAEQDGTLSRLSLLGAGSSLFDGV
ncbi:hypothetical protein OG339_42835 [Streptosporangium sp. NBC_01495]|nr:hypothetical protein [Streptosporangium sp. NBC_01495]